MADLQIKPAGKIPYTEKVWNEYKERLANTLREKGVTCDQLFNDPDLKNFVTNYMSTEILTEKKDRERILTNTNIRLAHLDIETDQGIQTYPIVNEYTGHHLQKTYYFYKDENDSCKMGCVEVVTKSILLR